MIHLSNASPSKRMDWGFLIVITLLITVGLVNLYSATRPVPSLGLFSKQILLYTVGFILFFCITLIKMEWFQKYAWWIYGALVLMLALVLLAGKVVNGARRWIELGFFQLQPSELIKIGLILVYARLFSGGTFDLAFRPIPYTIAWHLVWLLPVGLIMKQPDLGTALICIFISVSMFVVGRLHVLIKLAVLALDTLIAVGVFLFGLSPYQRNRIVSFLSPESDPLGLGWHANQAIIAIGSGKWWGKGYLQGTRTRLRFVPEHWTDFPFAVLAEEWGFAGSCVVLILYACLILWTLRIAHKARDRFSRNVVIGCTALLLWHVVMNIAMVTRMAPVVGVTLPLMSYGGSSLLTVLVALGFCMNVSMRNRANSTFRLLS